MPEMPEALRLASHIDNPFVALQQQYSKAMVEALNLFRDLRDDLIERIFHAVYGSPLAQAACSASAPSRRRRWRSRLSAAIVAGLALSFSAPVAWSVQCKPHHFRAPYFIKTMGRCGFD